MSKIKSFGIADERAGLKKTSRLLIESKILRSQDREIFYESDTGRRGEIVEIGRGYITVQWDGVDLERLRDEEFTTLKETGKIVFIGAE